MKNNNAAQNEESFYIKYEACFFDRKGKITEPKAFGYFDVRDVSFFNTETDCSYDTMVRICLTMYSGKVISILHKKEYIDKMFRLVKSFKNIN